ncbi:zinc-dependent metalloprotease, partial [Streptomyces beijiangensis]|uniref:zinc-dependent metalloprotease n=1 Tax=Streptomyces beijiangensis TaxID=163361 RepID=UPI00355604F9
AETAAFHEALRLADLWLDGATSLPSGASTAVAWSRADTLGHRVHELLPHREGRLDPLGAAMGGVLPEEMQAMAGPLL